MRLRASVLAAVVLACGGQKTQTTAPQPSASVARPVAPLADADAGVGRIDPAAVRQVVRAGAPHFMLCYADGLKKKLVTKKGKKRATTYYAA